MAVSSAEESVLRQSLRNTLGLQVRPGPAERKRNLWYEEPGKKEQCNCLRRKR